LNSLTRPHEEVGPEKGSAPALTLDRIASDRRILEGGAYQGGCITSKGQKKGKDLAKKKAGIKRERGNATLLARIIKGRELLEIMGFRAPGGVHNGGERF